MPLYLSVHLGCLEACNCLSSPCGAGAPLFWRGSERQQGYPLDGVSKTRVLPWGSGEGLTVTLDLDF